MDFEKAPQWEVVLGANTFEEFKDLILDKIEMNTNIPSSILDRIDIAKKLLLHSYYEYLFLDVAYTYMVATFEKSLRIRYEEITGEKTKRSFQNLTNWFWENGYFESWNKEYVDRHRLTRNHQLHDTQEMIGGLMLVRSVGYILDLINELYEDVELRKSRKKIIAQLQSFFNELIKPNGCIITRNNKIFIIFNNPLHRNIHHYCTEIFTKPARLFNIPPTPNQVSILGIIKL